MFLLFLIFSVFLVSKTQCFTPNCVRDNQFRNYGFPVEGCSENFNEKCKFHPKGYFNSLGHVSLVKIQETAIIPTCAFFADESIIHIYGVNSKIKVLATNAFTNMPNLITINLRLNQIMEVRKDVFKNVSVQHLDLSWNKIIFIDSQAFNQVVNLESLDLSRNSLQVISINTLSKTIKSLNLSHNLLEAFALNSASFLNLTYVDASHNIISRVAISFQYPVEVIDLGHNHIENFDYMDISSVEKFKMGNNFFKEAPRYLENVIVREIDIYPNPWMCDKLFLLWETLVSFKIRLAPKEKGKNPPPECVQSMNSRLLTVTRSTDCLDDYDCPSYMVCRTRKCWDPCEESLCHKSNFCETKTHVLNCSCSKGLLADPLDIMGKCTSVECYIDSHCPKTHTCWLEKCKNIHDINDGKFKNPSNSRPRPDSIADILPQAPELPWWFGDIPSFAPPIPKHSLKNKTVTVV